MKFKISEKLDNNIELSAIYLISIFLLLSTIKLLYNNHIFQIKIINTLIFTISISIIFYLSLIMIKKIILLQNIKPTITEKEANNLIKKYRKTNTNIKKQIKKYNLLLEQAEEIISKYPTNKKIAHEKTKNLFKKMKDIHSNIQEQSKKSKLLTKQINENEILFNNFLEFFLFSTTIMSISLMSIMPITESFKSLFIQIKNLTRKKHKKNHFAWRISLDNKKNRKKLYYIYYYPIK